MTKRAFTSRSARRRYVGRQHAWRGRNGQGQSLVEVMAGFMVFIPLAFLAVDIVGVTSASQSNEQLAETLARVCANQANQALAQRAAEDAAQNYQTGGAISSVDVESVVYDVGLGQVKVTTVMNFKMPIPLPGYTSMALRANAIQPIVATPAPL